MAIQRGMPGWVRLCQRDRREEQQEQEEVMEEDSMELQVDMTGRWQTVIR